MNDQEWKQQVDYKSIASVINILPEVFERRIIHHKFDNSLLYETKESDYNIPLYYVTKAWDVLLKGTLGDLAYLMGPDEEDDCSEDAIIEYLADTCATRSRAEAIKCNDQIKIIWKKHFGIDIDALDVDFLQFDKHFPPSISEDECHQHFTDAEVGAAEWVSNLVNFPVDDWAFNNIVSGLMEYTLYILRYQRKTK